MYQHETSGANPAAANENDLPSAVRKYRSLIASLLLRAIPCAEQKLRAELWCEKNPGWFREENELVTLDRARWRFHDPPNLEMKYRRRRKICQEKNAKCG